MATLVVKTYLEMPDLSVETRRFMIESGNADTPGIYDVVYSKIESVFPDLQNKRFTLYWKDDDEDFVTISTDEETRDVVSNATNGVCRIYVKVKEDEPQQTTGQNPTSVDAQSSAGKGNHEMAAPSLEQSPFPPQAGFFPPGPPPPPHPFAGGHFGGPWGWKGRGRHFHGFPGHHHPYGHDGGHHWHGHGGHHAHGHEGHHAHGHGGHRGHHHGHCHWGMHQGHGGRHGWKDALRNAVPMPHRRWAKGFIQSWRQENIKNATSTSESDCNLDWQTTMADSGVSQAYADWLNMKLARWHMKWCSNEMVAEMTINKDDKKAKKSLKASVPVEFRKWTKWYLNSHFGKRDAPEFNGCHGGQAWKEEAAIKKNYIRAQVPKEYRVCTKKFIRNWRLAKHLDEPLTQNTEDSDGDMDVNGDMLPEAYKEWLGIFLTRWHTWRGMLERDPSQSMRGGMKGFQDTVPMEYRTWVKFYLNNFNNCKRKCPKASTRVDLVQGKYQKMLQAFQKKWLRQQQLMDEDSDAILSTSSSDDETSTKKGEPESSFERLSLDVNNGGNKKGKVHFDGQPEGIKQKKLKMMEDMALEDSDGGHDHTFRQRKVPMNSDFRQWAKQALAEWDGETIVDDANQETEVPPNVYRWMNKVTMKMQMKKMKKQFKAAKQDMKAAKKQQKHGAY